VTHLYVQAEGVVRTWQEIVHTIGISPDEGTCMLVLNTAARHGLSALADDALRALRVIEVPWKEQHFAPLIAALARAGQLREAFGALELMRTAGVVPTTETAEPIFDAIRKSTDVVDDAWAALDEMHEQGRAIDALALTTIVRAAVALGDLQRAVGVYKGAGALGVTPDVHAYNALLEGCVAARHRELGDQLLAEMRTAEVSPTAATYLQLVLLCLTQVPYEHAFFYLEEMKAQGHVPPVIAYESLVRKCRAHEDPRWRLAAEEMRACGYEYSRVFQDVADELGGGRGEYQAPEPEREPDLAGMGRRADRQTRQDEFAANVQTFLRADRRAK
jgi:pentatricopeptide repeat protein